MLFSSLVFLFRYLPIVLILYFIAPKSLKNLILFAVSLFFYAWGEPVYVVLMLFSTFVDYTHGMLVDKYKHAGNIKAAQIALISSIVINLGLLGFFKYTGFIVENINALFGLAIPFNGVALPIGISFYTFQTMSYTIDVYLGNAKPQKNIISFGAYVALFPQLIAGPIVQYKTIAEQLEKPLISTDNFAYGIMRFVSGLGKKVLLANTAGEIFSLLKDGGELTVLASWMAILAYTFQIYFDFSGYSDMAIGLGRMFGFKFLENFDHPYESKSITEFWRRWHISLGSWFRDYVYIPLGGNRVSVPRHFANIFTVWLLTGIWHGASWNFVFWGIYYGILLMIEKLFLLKYLKRAPAFLGHIYTMLIVIFGWVLFEFTNLSEMSTFLMAMFGQNGLYDRHSLYMLFNNLPLLIICALGCTSLPVKLANKFETTPIVVRTGAKLVFISVVFVVTNAFLVNSSYNPFLYFRF